MLPAAAAAAAKHGGLQKPQDLFEEVWSRPSLGPPYLLEASVLPQTVAVLSDSPSKESLEASSSIGPPPA